MKARKLIRLGRKRKQSAREPNGRTQRAPQEQTEDQIMSVAIAQRKKIMPKGFDKKKLRDQKVGDVFGRLRLTDQITETQYRAGIFWRDGFLPYARVMGIPLPRTLGTLASIGYIPGEDHSDTSEKTATAIKRRYHDIASAIRDHCRDADDVRSALFSIIMMDKHPGDMALGNLRTGCNIIARQFKTHEDT